MSTVGNALYIPLGRRTTPRGPSAHPQPAALPKARGVKQDPADAFPALLTAGKAAFGDRKVIFFTMQKIAGAPERHISRVTVKVPDGPERSFPWSSAASNVVDARMGAATKAVRAGGLSFLEQWLPPRTYEVVVQRPARSKRRPLTVEPGSRAEALNANLRRLGPRGSMSWRLCQLEDGFSALLTVDLPSGRRTFGSVEAVAGRNVKESKDAVLKQAVDNGLLLVILADLGEPASR